ncbi:Uncharacterised protein [Mycobacteroides abscessus subsp. abscessus]|nr:Uncharacterised protein [Mycobacteroides abscessus subsp. abscessus]
MHRHGRTGSEDPGLVARAGYHAAPTGAADEHRTTTQGGPGQLLDRSEEGVHVEVQNPSTGSTHAPIVLRPTDCPGVSLSEARYGLAESR